MRSRRFVLPLLLVAGACHHGSSSSASAPLVLSAGLQELPSEAALGLPAGVDLQRLGLDHVDRVYRLTTPADTPFHFEVVTTTGDNTGMATVALAHAAEAGAPPTGGERSLAEAGFVPLAAGLMRDTQWLSAWGAGFSRMTLRGVVVRDQVLAIVASNEHGRTAALVEVVIGERSPINADADATPVDPGVLAQQSIYSSDSWLFCAPVVAVSGDRTSVVVYDGDAALLRGERRYEVRMQHDRATGAVTGGGRYEPSSDSGNWRDHELAALYNVLAVVHCGTDTAEAMLSFDRGASFAQTTSLDAGDAWTRLGQCAIAADYTLAVTFWRGLPGSADADLVLVEGRPSAFDLQGSPTAYAFLAPQVIASVPDHATPLISGIDWSAGGDLAVAWAWTQTDGFIGGSRTHYHCAVRPHGEPLVDREVDVDIAIPMDPSVALLGSGAALRVFYGYETASGMRLAVSDDGGRSYAPPLTFSQAGALLPKVFARQLGADTHVDVLYTARGENGNELHHSRWVAFPTSPREDYRLSTASLIACAAQPGGNTWTGSIDFGFRIRQLAQFGYDATLDGDQIVVVYDEDTVDAWFQWFGAWTVGTPMTAGGIFAPATPPPLAAGMTLPMPAPNPAHRHQLRLVRLQ